MALQVATLFGAAMALGGALMLGLGIRHVWRASKVLRAPGPDEADAADASIVRLRGTVAEHGEELVEAPFSGTEVVVERHVVEERQLNPSVPVLPWDVVLEEGTASAPFDLRTAETTATVDGRIGTAILGRETVTTIGVGEALPDRIAAFHEQRELSTEPLGFGSLPGPLARIGRAVGLGKRTYSEERLKIGDEATIVGYPVDGAAAVSGTVDPLIVSDRSPHGTFFAMAKTGLVASVLGIGVLAIGLLLLLV